MKKVIRIDLDATTPESAPARVAGGRVIENCEDGHAAAGLAALPSTSRPDTTAVGPREVELKLQLPPGSRATLEGSPAFAAAEADQRHEVTTYFDTPDGVLDHAGLTLRVRRSGDTRTQTVKSCATGRGVATNRREWEWRIGQDAPNVNLLEETKELAKAARAIQGRLEPMVVTDIRRTVRLLHLDDNTVVEVAIDEGRILAGGTHEPVSELELELKAGHIGQMYRLAAELQVLAPLWISPESKSARGWHLRTGQTRGAQKAPTLDLRRRVRAADGFREIIEGTLGHLMANIGPTLRGDAEGVHQMRIALRRCRAALNLFERHLDSAAAARFASGLQRFGQLFGTARDWDVFCLDTLPAAMVDLPAERLRDLNVAAEVERLAAHAAVAAALRDNDFTALVLDIAVWVAADAALPPLFPNGRMGERLGVLAPSLLERVARKAIKRGRHASRLSVEELHRLRKSLKKLRYDVDSLGGLYRQRAVKAYRGHCERLEEILGVANDAVVAKRLALKLVTDNRQDLAKPAGALARLSERRGQKALKGLKDAMKDFRATPGFWS